MKVNEIFASIQGEGIYQGLPTVFVRLQGCNLHCQWCDTAYARNPSGGEEWAVRDVINEVIRLAPNYDWVCITGGEPLFQEEEVGKLVEALRKKEYKIEIETNGSLPAPPWWNLVDSWCTDIKLPASGEADKSFRSWLGTRRQDQVKFVVADERDLIYTTSILDRHPNLKPTALVSPVFPMNYNEGEDGICIENEWLQRVVEFCKEHHVRFSLQWHKVVYGNKKGV